jgi:hypothetical protein
MPILGFTIPIKTFCRNFIYAVVSVVAKLGADAEGRLQDDKALFYHRWLQV